MLRARTPADIMRAAAAFQSEVNALGAGPDHRLRRLQRYAPALWTGTMLPCEDGRWLLRSDVLADEGWPPEATSRRAAVKRTSVPATPLVDPVLHVALLPEGHQATPECGCGPLVYAIDVAILHVHYSTPDPWPSE